MAELAPESVNEDVKEWLATEVPQAEADPKTEYQQKGEKNAKKKAVRLTGPSLEGSRFVGGQFYRLAGGGGSREQSSALICPRRLGWARHPFFCVFCAFLRLFVFFSLLCVRSYSLLCSLPPGAGQLRRHRLSHLRPYQTGFMRKSLPTVEPSYRVYFIKTRPCQSLPPSVW